MKLGDAVNVRTHHGYEFTGLVAGFLPDHTVHDYICVHIKTGEFKGKQVWLAVDEVSPALTTNRAA